MTKKEYQEKIKAIEIKAKNEKITVMYEYALTNNPYNIGDIIQNHSQKIRIEKIKPTIAFNNIFPECIFYGPLLKKNGKPFKNKKKEAIRQSSIQK
jgi:hypothetical protein